MTKENLEELTNAYEKVKKFEYGAVARRFLEKEDLGGAVGALKTLFDSKEHELYKRIIDIGLSSEKGIDMAAQGYASDHQKALQELPLDFLYEKRYEDVIGNYVKKDKLDLIGKVFSEFSEMTYGDLVKKITQANEVLKSNTGRFSDEDKRKAKKESEKYKDVFRALNLAEEAIFEKLRPEAIKYSLKDNFDKYVNELTNGE